MKLLLKFKRNTEGQSLVEFALIVPFLLALILGMIEFGWILNAKITVTSAAREGARFYAVSKDASKVRENVEKTTINSGLNIIEVTPVKEVDYTENVDNVKVTVKASISPIVGLFVHEDVEMQSIAIMRQE